MTRLLVSILGAINGLAAILIVSASVSWSLRYVQVNDPRSIGLVFGLVGLVVGLVLAGVVCGLLAVALSIEQSLRKIADKRDRVAEPRPPYPRTWE